MSPTYSASGVLAAVGLLSCLGSLVHLSSLLWLYVRPSSLHRYLHTTKGKPAWALVTGATGGIGMELSHELATRGFNVVLHGRSTEKLQQAKAELEQAHPGRVFRTLVIDASQVAKATTADYEAWAASLDDIGLTVVINNAGGATERSIGPLEALTPNRLLTDANVNALFPTLLLGQLVPQLKRNAPGLIINIGSLADLGIAYTGSYSASKAYMMKMTESLNREMRLMHHDVEVLGVRVGNVWGTGQSVVKNRDIFSPDATTMAKAILARVGCGKHHVVGYWPHALQFEASQLLPGFVLDYALANEVKGFDIETKKMD